MIVIKFGGTSVGSAAAIRSAVAITKARLDRSPVVVVSAVSGVTDLLVRAAKEASEGNIGLFSQVEERHREIVSGLGLEMELIAPQLDLLRAALEGIYSGMRLGNRDIDLVCSFGERISARIFAGYARKEGIDAESFDSYELGMLSDENFGSAEVLEESYVWLGKSIAALRKGIVPVITGFIARSMTGSITTLGRGGSDYSAAIIGAAVRADEVQIWTDADGIMTADPKIVSNASTIPRISFDEASEIAHLGAKVLHPKTILPLMRRDIPVRVLNTFKPSCAGTVIVSSAENSMDITAIVSRRNVAIININSARMFMMHGFLHKIFKIFDEHRVAVDMISTSEVNVSVTVDRVSSAHALPALIAELERIAEVNVKDGKASISVVGRAIQETSSVAAIFSALAANGVRAEMVSQGSSEINMCLVVDGKDCEESVKVLHSAFFGEVSL
ncbi:aspartate kinase [Candidatus Woesearchaeota archaeon]|nr:aspartate kinase [Candidatus Woesearchaeota archaeon]